MRDLRSSKFIDIKRGRPEMRSPRFAIASEEGKRGRVARFCSLALTFVAGFAVAQEPGLLRGVQAVRFEEAPGLYHYITPCSQDKPDIGGVASNAWCWPVRAAHVQRVDGKVVQSETARGVIKISADEVSFAPDPDEVNIPLTPFQRSAVTFGHKAGTTEARFGNNDGVYLFVFEDRCFGCKQPSDPPDEQKVAQLEAEFALFHDALNDYAAVSERLSKLSANLLIKVAPHTEPTAAAKATTMGKYAELNRRLAEVCTDQARSCVLQYANYQACRAGAEAAGCGAAPQCSAELVLPKDFDMKEITLLLPKLEDAAELRPVGVIESSRGPVSLSPGVVSGQLVQRTPPEYPSIAKARHLSGRVTMRAIISKEGTIRLLEVSSTTDSIFNQAALDAVKTWRYRPYTLNGEPCEVDTIITVNFNINPPPRPAQMPGMPPG